jgi:hypothetical protein
MEPILFFYGPWTIEVTELILGAGGPAVRLVLDRAGAANGAHLNPAVGTRLEADGPEWILYVEVSFDLQPFQRLEPVREFAFDPQRGMTAIVKAGRQSPAFRAAIALKCTAHDPELRGHPANPYDFTLPENALPHGG